MSVSWQHTSQAVARLLNIVRKACSISQLRQSGEQRISQTSGEKEKGVSRDEAFVGG